MKFEDYDKRIVKRLEDIGFKLEFCNNPNKFFLMFANGFLKPEAMPTFLYRHCRFKTEEEAIEFMFSNMKFLSVLQKIDKNLLICIASVCKNTDGTYLACMRISHNCFYKFVETGESVRIQLEEQNYELRKMLEKQKKG